MVQMVKKKKDLSIYEGHKNGNSQFWAQTYKVYSNDHLLIHQGISSSSKQKWKGEIFIQFGFSFIGNKIIQTHSVLFLEKYLQIAARKCSCLLF